ncbi:MAG: hypothetical protein HQL51_11830, partial [Magnetococcales bacterium]|nr:hypothetical protein [Magnetococcales bacterium]
MNTPKRPPKTAKPTRIAQPSETVETISSNQAGGVAEAAEAIEPGEAVETIEWSSVRPKTGKTSPPRDQLTPMMRQYFTIKGEHPNVLLFYRMGDFYELFLEDARFAAPILEVTLTSRGELGGEPIPMCGIPVHALKTYLYKALAAGQRVAICEQMEPPGGKGPVRREVVRVVTPGTVIDEDLLQPRTGNYLGCLAVIDLKGGRGRKEMALAAIELSTGDFEVTPLTSWDHAASQLSRLEPPEILIPEDFPLPTELLNWEKRMARHGHWAFDPGHSARVLREHFQVEILDGFGIGDLPACQAAAGVLLEYCRQTQQSDLAHVTGLTRTHPEEYLTLDETCRRNLEINVSLRDGKRKGSLLEALDDTATPMGSRLLAQWINLPLRRLDLIRGRQEATAWLFRRDDEREEMRERLKGIPDLERLTGRIALGRASPRDLGAVRGALERLPEIATRLAPPL